MKKKSYRAVIGLVALAMPLGAAWAFRVLLNVQVAMIRWAVHRPAWWLPLWYVLNALFVVGAETIAVHLIVLMRTAEKDPFVKRALLY